MVVHNLTINISFQDFQLVVKALESHKQVLLAQIESPDEFELSEEDVGSLKNELIETNKIIESVN